MPASMMSVSELSACCHFHIQNMQNAGLIFNSSMFIFYVLEAEAEAFNLGCVVNDAWTLLEIHSSIISGE
jgi:hypothetical protein